MAEKIQFMHFIGKGPEAEALITAAREGRAKYADAVKAFIAEHGFENTWSYKDRGASSPLFAVQLSDEEAKVCGLKYHGRVSKDYAYTPRLNTAAGRKLAAALEQLNKDFFSANKFLLKETGMGHTVFYCGHFLFCKGGIMFFPVDVPVEAVVINRSGSTDACIGGFNLGREADLARYTANGEVAFYLGVVALGIGSHGSGFGNFETGFGEGIN